MPDEVKNLPSDMLPLLQSKLEEIISNNGLSGEGASAQSFVIYPVISVFGSQTTAGGMQNITVVNGNLSLVVKQVSTKAVFSSISKKIQGSGTNEEEAKRDIFNQINPSDQDYVTFVEKAKTKIINYYIQNCDNLIKRADADKAIKKYDEAMGILLSIPVEASGCFDKAQAKIKTTYDEMMMYSCKKFVQEARNYAAQNDYEDALQRLSWIDPTVNCGNEAKTLVNTMAKEVDNDQKKSWDLLFAIYKGEVEVAKAKAYARDNYSTYLITSNTPMIQYASLVQ